MAKLARENDVHHFSPQDILVTPGGKFALFAALSATLNPGDEVLILDPSWVTYGPMVQLTGGMPVRVQLDSTDNFAVSEDVLSAYITPRTKLLMVNSPNNPTGRVLTQSEIDAIVDRRDARGPLRTCPTRSTSTLFSMMHSTSAWPRSRAWPSAR